MTVFEPQLDLLRILGGCDDPDAMMPMEPLVATGGGCRGSEPVQTTLPAAGAHETQRGGAAVRGLLSRVFPEPPR